LFFAKKLLVLYKNVKCVQDINKGWTIINSVNRGEWNTKKFIKIFGNSIFILLILFFILSIIMSMNAKKNKDGVPTIFGHKSMIVLTGSMAPKINPGDIIITNSAKPENIKVGDVITYRVNSEMLITHRVTEVVSKEGRRAFKTKGDANNVEDNNLVTEDQLIGRYSFRIPYAGYVSNFARSIYGFVLLILIPIVLLIYDQLKTVLSELKKEKAEKQTTADNMDYK
jgi:signal peptidase